MHEFDKKAKSIRLFILDVDGILTSGLIYYGAEGEALKGFHVHDGFGIKLLQQCGITLAVISGRQSKLVTMRMKNLGIEHVFLGCDNKVPSYDTLKKQLQLNDHQIAYMGDDLPDLPIFKRVGLSVTVPEAPEIMRKHADFVTHKKAGFGAVREVCEMILKAQDQYQSVIQSYLSQ